MANFLDSFLGTSGESTPISFSDRTAPLILNPLDKDGCLQGIGFKISGAATQTTHLLPASIGDRRPIDLVDPNTHNAKDLQSGLLTISEIGFDDSHRFAVFTFKLVRSGLKRLFNISPWRAGSGMRRPAVVTSNRQASRSNTGRLSR
jgi:hypothetical protein